MSESTRWADCIMLAMAPLGVITILVSAIRVGGFRWLRALIGRSTENVVAVELEVMSCTSTESCELWNGQTVVRCPGTADICEFICLYPPNPNVKELRSVRIMDMEEAISNSKLLYEVPEYKGM
ncbi:ankyrin repeat protein [Colletotrichum kahawae]|uniref:Ankyrin repeat protein n=1 Tax=Colletotrichum kahawae TaxID=34407 RepID=A0AAD9Y5N5_COLKA|nr:ankyrin repeat protein [Colletotrichum kahawae]